MPGARLSRYEFANPFVDAKGRTFLDVPDPIPRSTLTRGASRRTIVASDTLWSLAWLAYESLLDPEQDVRPTGFFDVIGSANSVVNPILPLPVGKTFLLPTIEVLLGDVRVRPPFSAPNVVNS